MDQTQTLSQTAQEQLCKIDQSLFYIRRLLAGIALSYCSTVQQRKQLVGVAMGVPVACLPNSVPLQTASSLIILTALFFFAGLSRQTLERASSEQRCSAEIGHAGSLLVLAVALARLADLVRVNCAAVAPSVAQAESSGEDTAEAAAAESI